MERGGGRGGRRGEGGGGRGRRGEGWERRDWRREEGEGERGVVYLVCMLYFGSNTNLVCSGGLLPQHKMKVVERLHIEWVTSVVS